MIAKILPLGNFTSEETQQQNNNNGILMLEPRLEVCALELKSIRAKSFSHIL